MFILRYELSPYTKQTRLVFKGFILVVFLNIKCDILQALFFFSNITSIIVHYVFL